jgi:hypothetical protein
MLCLCAEPFVGIGEVMKADFECSIPVCWRAYGDRSSKYFGLRSSNSGDENCSLFLKVSLQTACKRSTPPSYRTLRLLERKTCLKRGSESRAYLGLRKWMVMQRL